MEERGWGRRWGRGSNLKYTREVTLLVFGGQSVHKTHLLGTHFGLPQWPVGGNRWLINLLLIATVPL